MSSLLLVAVLLGVDSPAARVEVGPLVRALWFVQRHGTSQAVNPQNDTRVKGVLAKALAKDGVISLVEMGDLMEPGPFKTFAGEDGVLDASELTKAVEAAVPESRISLLPQARAHADFLTTSFDMIDEPHRAAGQTLAEWIAKNYKSSEPLNVIVVCTGNSRRSILGATMGNLAAAYYGMPEIRFHSGGTAPTAFNSRTITALKEIGIEVEPTGKEAKRGEPKTANPIYRVRWGTANGARFETTEFSKHYGDPVNPQNGFAALMVCGEADAACPFVKGASLRVSMPYLDPKIYDDGSYESAKYAERRDDIGRLMLAVMMQARTHIAGKP